MTGDPIDRAAKAAIQDATGTPAAWLRGLTPQDALMDFAARRLAQPPTQIEKASTEVVSTISTFPQGTIRTNEQPLPIQPLGGGGLALGPVDNVIINDNGTLNYYSVNMTFTGVV